MNRSLYEIRPQELRQKMAAGHKFVLLDVRRADEVATASLPHTVHIPIEEIEFRAEELNPDDEIVVYCHQGVRSAAVAAYLRERGFARAANLAGGLDHWARTVDPAMRRY